MDEFQTVRESAVWSPHLLNGERTIFVVVGDYYIFGETDDSMEISVWSASSTSIRRRSSTCA